jgi:hypothetical protein
MTEKQPSIEPVQKDGRIQVWNNPKRVDIEVLDEYSREPIKDGDWVPYTRLTVRRLRDEDLLSEDPNAPTSRARTHTERFGGKDSV